MPRRLDVLLGSTLLVAVLLACANASPVFRLDATEADSTAAWVQGRQVLTRTTDSVTVAVAYERTTGRNHIFRVLVRNRGDSTFTFDPSRTTARLTGAWLRSDSLDTIPPKLLNRQVQARDPEQEILEAELDQSRAKARAANAAAFDLLALTLDTAGDVAEAASGGRTPEERTADAVEDAEMVENMERRARERRATINAYEQSRMKWSSLALRKTTLLPATHAGGRLYVPLVEDARTIELRIAAGPHVFSFFYHQIRHDPDDE